MSTQPFRQATHGGNPMYGSDPTPSRILAASPAPVGAEVAGDLLVRHGDPQLDGDHERMKHLVLEGFKPDDGSDFVPAGPSVAEGIVNGTAVRALCGKLWIPNGDPKRYPLCPTCEEIAAAHGWTAPG